MAQQIAQSGDPAKIRTQLELMRKGMMSDTQQLSEAQQQEKNRHDQALETQASATAANTSAYRNAELGLRRQQIGVQGAELKLKQDQAGVASDGSPTPLATAIASGHIPVDRMGYLLAKNPGLVEGVMKVDPTFDGSKAAAYPSVYKDFTSTKPNTAGGALNAGGTALGHLLELKNMNTVESHIPGTPDYTAYMNKVDTVATELAKFYGDSTVPGIASIKRTLASNLPGNRDAAIATQAQSMGDKFDAYQQSWENAAPSKSYQAPLPGISPKAIAARAALDPNFRAAQVAKSGASRTAPPQSQDSGGKSNDPFAQFGGKAH
jgi:hypothetical protein